MKAQNETGQPSTTIPGAVGQEAKGHPSKSFPHQFKLMFSNPRNKYSITPMNASPASKAPDNNCRRWHLASCSDENRRIDEFNPVVRWKSSVSEKDKERGDGTSEKEPVDGRVGAEVSEDAAGPNEAPDDGGIIEDVVGWACPWAVGGEELGVADVGD